VPPDYLEIVPDTDVSPTITDLMTVDANQQSKKYNTLNNQYYLFIALIEMRDLCFPMVIIRCSLVV
jgi:hypothetical protein